MSPNTWIVHRIAAFALVAFMAIPSHASEACEVMDGNGNEWIVRVPFEIIDGRIYVQADVNGVGSFRFAIDTGASGMGRADASLVSALGLVVHGSAVNSDGVASAQADVTRLRSLALGDLVHGDIDVITRDYSGNKPAEDKFFGIIGREFFGDGLLVIDYPGRTLYFARSLSLEDRPGVLRYDRPFRVPVSIGDITTTGNLDTGANVTLVLPLEIYARVSDAPLGDAGTGKLSNTEIATNKARMRGPVVIGDLALSDVEVRVSDRYPEVLVGAHAFQDSIVMFDQRSRSVAICPRPDGKDLIR